MPYTNDFFRRAGACSRRHFIRTAEDVCPYSEKTSVYFLSHQKSVAGATQQNFAPTLKRCGAWDTIASVPTTFLLLFSSPEKRSYYTQPKDTCPDIPLRHNRPCHLSRSERLYKAVIQVIRREQAPALQKKLLVYD